MLQPILLAWDSHNSVSIFSIVNAPGEKSWFAEASTLTDLLRFSIRKMFLYSERHTFLYLKRIFAFFANVHVAVGSHFFNQLGSHLNLTE